MASKKRSNLLKRLRKRYRLVILDEENFEEVFTVRINRRSLYISLSMIVVVGILLVFSLVAFTPLKYYIPGYGRTASADELEMLKLKADSIEHSLILKQQYIDDIQRVLKGRVIPADTATLKIAAPAPFTGPGKKTRKND